MVEIELLGEYGAHYIDIHVKDETNFSKIFRCTKKENGQNVCLKVIDKNKLKEGDYNYLLKQIKREEEIATLCNSNYTVNLYRKLEDSKFIIFEFENLEGDLKNYIFNNGNLGNNKKNFKKIVLILANALKIIHKNGIIHRDIKPNNIFIDDEESEEFGIAKLGEFFIQLQK